MPKQQYMHLNPSTVNDPGDSSAPYHCDNTDCFCLMEPPYQSILVKVPGCSVDTVECYFLCVSCIKNVKRCKFVIN